MQAEILDFLPEEQKETELYILAELFKMLGNPTRINILLLLMEQDSCVSDLAERLGLTQPAVSHQLSLLKSNRLVKRRKDGKLIFYTVVDNHVCLLIKKGMEHVREKRGKR